MTYYEELGLPCDASVQDIRQAYRVLARLVHPDGQANEQVRDMAERQMKRLNDILAILSDAQRRREYDDSLLALSGAPAPPPASAGPMAAGAAAKVAGMHRPSPVRFRPHPEPWRTRLPAWANVALINWFWIVLAVVILGVSWWYVSAGKSPAPVPTADAKPKPLAVDELRPASPPVPDTSTQKTAPAPREAPQPRTAVSAQPASKPAPAAAPPQLPAPVEAPSREVAAVKEPDRPFLAPASQPQPAAPLGTVQPEPSHAVAASRTAVPSFAGNWLYVPTSGDPPAPGSYPATYVELLLTEEHGELSGSYRAKYRIPDQAVSPEVLFRVQGKSSSGESAKLGWTSSDGAKGEVELKLHGPRVMSVTWWTTEFGRHASLASGTAKLLRQQVQ
jgi:hypothetical protein